MLQNYLCATNNKALQWLNAFFGLILVNPFVYRIFPLQGSKKTSFLFGHHLKNEDDVAQYGAHNHAPMIHFAC